MPLHMRYVRYLEILVLSKDDKSLMHNNKIEATGMSLGGFLSAGCPCASFRSLCFTNITPMTQEQIIELLKKYKMELECILSRFTKSRDSIHIKSEDDARFREMVVELRDLFIDEFVGSRSYVGPLIDYFNDSVSNFIGSPSYKGVENVKGLISAALTRVERNPLALKSTQISSEIQYSKNPDYLEVIAERFHLVVRQLRQRYSDRSTLDVSDEYDVQDLFHSLLTLFYDDIRNEEWTPSYAGGSARIDFLLPEIESVVEIKKMRSSLSTKELGEQLLIDIAKYKTHPLCRTLVCFVYDPEGRVSNPRGVENDLNKSTNDINVKAIIVPKGY